MLGKRGRYDMAGTDSENPDNDSSADSSWAFSPVTAGGDEWLHSDTDLQLDGEPPRQRQKNAHDYGEHETSPSLYDFTHLPPLAGTGMDSSPDFSTHASPPGMLANWGMAALLGCSNSQPFPLYSGSPDEIGVNDDTLPAQEGEAETTTTILNPPSATLFSIHQDTIAECKTFSSEKEHLAGTTIAAASSFMSDSEDSDIVSSSEDDPLNLDGSVYEQPDDGLVFSEDRDIQVMSAATLSSRKKRKPSAIKSTGKASNTKLEILAKPQKNTPLTEIPYYNNKGENKATIHTNWKKSESVPAQEFLFIERKEALCEKPKGNLPKHLQEKFWSIVDSWTNNSATVYSCPFCKKVKPAREKKDILSHIANVHDLWRIADGSKQSEKYKEALSLSGISSPDTPNANSAAAVPSQAAKPPAISAVFFTPPPAAVSSRVSSPTNTATSSFFSGTGQRESAPTTPEPGSASAVSNSSLSGEVDLPKIIGFGPTSPLL
jgi:hypothetical protein